MAICVGCGLTVNGFGVLEVDLADPGSGLACDNTAGLSINAFVQNGNCVTLTGNGTSASRLTPGLTIDPNGALVCGGPGLAIERSPDDCNGVFLNANGLFTHCPDSLVGSANMGFEGGAPPFGIVGPLNFYNLQMNCGTQVAFPCDATANGIQIRFTNPTCCTVEGFWEFIVYGGVINGASNDFDATAFLTTSINGSAYGETPQTNVKYYGADRPGFADIDTFELGGFHAKNYHILGPGASFTVKAQMTVFVAVGSATWAVGPNFEVYAHFTQTGCC